MRATTLCLAAALWLALPAMAGARVIERVDGATGAGPASAVRLGSSAKHLTAKHSGWRKTACLTCHDATSVARHKNPALKPTDCGPCHGYNGAPHEAHAIPINPCGRCHARVEHAAAFTAPGECIQCHVHPASPNGR